MWGRLSSIGVAVSLGVGALALPGIEAGAARAAGPPPFRIGFAKATVDPRPDEIAGGQLHLGGFGLGPTRASTGPAVSGDGTVEHIYARAMAVTNTANTGGQTMLFAALENQGTFAAYKQGPYGLYDVRKKVSDDTGVPIGMIVINSDHSHAVSVGGGPET